MVAGVGADNASLFIRIPYQWAGIASFVSLLAVQRCRRRDLLAVSAFGLARAFSRHGLCAR
jgi:hypothetical protein